MESLSTDTPAPKKVAKKMIAVKTIYEILQNSPGRTFSWDEVSRLTGLEIRKVQHTLSALKREGSIKQIRPGFYQCPIKPVSVIAEQQEVLTPDPSAAELKVLADRVTVETPFPSAARTLQAARQALSRGGNPLTPPDRNDDEMVEAMLRLRLPNGLTSMRPRHMSAIGTWVVQTKEMLEVLDSP